MSTSTTLPAKEIERTYMVQLTPLDGPDDIVGIPFEPERTRLRYTEAQAAELDPTSEEALQEAIDRAIRVERQRYSKVCARLGKPEVVEQPTRFEGQARLVAQGLVDYLPRAARRRRGGRS